MPAAIIIGASTGIGRALAEELAGRGWRLGLMARRRELLEELRESLPGEAFVAPCDVAQAESARRALRALVETMGQVDMVVVNAGVGLGNYKLYWERDATTIDVNIKGFTAMATAAFEFFSQQGHGHLVGVSSVARFRGQAYTAAYAASKAYVSHYLEGLRLLSWKRKLGIRVTDVRPGFVETPMTAEHKKMLWAASAQTAARQIADGLERGRKTIYTLRRWGLFAPLIAAFPEWLYRKIY